MPEPFLPAQSYDNAGLTMQIFRHIGDPALMLEKSVVTLGNFDGIHLGHQALITGAITDAKQFGIPSVVLTFEPHPLKILAPERAPRMLLTHKDKMQILRSLGVDVVIVQHFDLSFAQLSAEQFVREFVVDRLKARKIWVGRDLRFGQGRKGQVEDLLRWGPELGFEVAAVDPILVNGARVSSSRVRQSIHDGRVNEVQAMLGRYHFVSGRVTAGHRRGKDLGFPTANISTRTEVLPMDGIYATLLQLGEKNLPSVSSVGVNPTFGEGPRTVESFILNFKQDIYGEAVKLSFVQRIREEKKFSSADELVVQIHQDVKCAETIFRELHVNS
jgi:riboflavin kinase / FMN adenylyltransferase